jgi:hypothetical protein
MQHGHGGTGIGVERAKSRGELGGGSTVDGVAAGRAIQETVLTGPDRSTLTA